MKLRLRVMQKQIFLLLIYEVSNNNLHMSSDVLSLNRERFLILINTCQNMLRNTNSLKTFQLLTIK